MAKINALTPKQARGKEVFVYRNLHQNCWSVKSKETGRIIAHADEVILSDVDYKVSQAGRERVLREKSKNVHAGLQGTLVNFDPIGGKMPTYPAATFSTDPSVKPEPGAPINITYNPYKYQTFVARHNEQGVKSSESAILRADKQVMATNVTFFNEVA
jgi:hypothetical protein